MSWLPRFFARLRPEQSGAALRLRLLVAGVLLIFGGETFCLLGPMRFERLVHVLCHAVLYAGIGCSGIGAVLYWAGRRGKLRQAPTPPP